MLCTYFRGLLSPGYDIGGTHHDLKSHLSRSVPHKKQALNQGCQIFLGTIYQNEEIYTKLPQNTPKGIKISNGCKIDQISI
jgi:hypothetical protein